MKKDSKQRLFEVMSVLDKTFKHKLNEDFSDEIPADITQNNDELPKEKTPEEKLQELTAKVDEIYALLHGEEQETPDNNDENLQEWNFDKKKNEKKEDKENNDDESDDDEESDENKKELDEAKPKLPVAAIPKVGK